MTKHLKIKWRKIKWEFDVFKIKEKLREIVC